MAYEIQRHEVARGKLLKILVADYPNPIDSVLLRRLLDTFGMPVREEALLSYVAYLEERGYVRTETRRGSDIRMVSATATGVDVVDGRVEDEGVDIGY